MAPHTSCKYSSLKSFVKASLASLWILFTICVLPGLIICATSFAASIPNSSLSNAKNTFSYLLTKSKLDAIFLLALWAPLTIDTTSNWALAFVSISNIDKQSISPSVITKFFLLPLLHWLNNSGTSALPILLKSLVATILFLYALIFLFTVIG